MQFEPYPRTYIENQQMLGEHRLPARSLLLPAQKRGVTNKSFTDSDRVQLLNGNWKFCYLQEDTDAPFFLPEEQDDGWDILPVPSMWQFHGYGSCYYPNVRYCFPYDPPYIHRSNPVGLYRTTFTAVKHARTVLRFLGVDNAYFVWLNGQYVGFSKGSCVPAEFDVTSALRNGNNLLAVKVYTFSDASYLENQDMLMASGIFRDVLLIHTGATALWDETILPAENGFCVQYCCTVGDVSATIRLTLCDANGNVCAACEQKAAETGEVFLPIRDAILWNAEQPYLYTLYTELLENGAVTEVHTKKCGIAKSEVNGCSLLMNGKPITLKGVIHSHLAAVLPVFEDAGCVFAARENELKITAPERLRSMRIVRTMPYPGFPTDAQAPLLAAAAVADGTTVLIENIFENRYRHAAELARMGADVKTEGKFAVVEGVPRLYGAAVEAADLRGAAALVAAGLCAEGKTELGGVRYLDRGYESFEQVLSALGADVKRV